MKPETRKTGGRILLATMSLTALLIMLILTSCDIVGNLLGGGNEDPTTPTNLAASFQVAITGSAFVDGKINFGGDFGVKITDNKNPNEPISYQWTLDGVPIPGDTKSTHKFIITDEGKALGINVTIKNETVVATEIAIPKRTITIAFSGTAFDDKGVLGKEGNIIADVSTNWTATDKDGKELNRTLQWAVNGQDIEGANKDNLNLTSEYAGRSLTFKVIYGDITQTSTLKIPTTSNQTKTITATIMGTPGVGQELFADVQKNFTGPPTEIQWYVDGVAVDGYRGKQSYFYPDPSNCKKRITIKAKCGTVESAPSQPVTIPAFTYTAEVEWWDESRLYAVMRVGDNGWMATPDQGVAVKWFNNGVLIPNETSYMYNLRPEDAGATITAQIFGYDQSPTSNGIQIFGVPPVNPISIEYNNYSGHPDQVVDEIAREIEEAYDNNLGGCRTAINNRPWCVDFVENEDDRNAEVIEGKLHIYFSCAYYDTFDTSNRTTRLNQVGTELKVRAVDAKFISKYSGNFEDILMAKLKKPGKKYLTDRIVG
jgi:hypothetical protein